MLVDSYHQSWGGGAFDHTRCLRDLLKLLKACNLYNNGNGICCGIAKVHKLV
jgi:hypothetical protein